jgi:hypothetical protein
VSRILKLEGYEVLTANNGLQALALLKGHPGPVDLVITDMVMPGMGGKELADRVGVDWPDQRILFTSGYTDDTIRLGGLPNITAQFISKPYTAVDLARKVRELLDREVGSLPTPSASASGDSDASP